MRVLFTVYGSHEAREARGSRGDAEPMVGLVVRLRALQARGVAMPVCAPLMAGGTTPAILTGGWQ